MSSQTRPGLHSWVGFENNLFCNTYAKYVKYAKYVCIKYVKYVIYAKYAKYVMLVYNLGGGENAVSCSVEVDMLWRFTAYKLDRVISGSA